MEDNKMMTSGSSATQPNTLPTSSGKRWQERIRTISDLISKASPKAQADFAKYPEKAVCGDYPTLTEVDQRFGAGSAQQWLAQQMTNLSLYTGARNMNVGQIDDLVRTIIGSYPYLKITELLLFLHRFKRGDYGKFYGAVDPLVISGALTDFMKERGNIIVRHEQEERERRRREEAKANPPMSWEEYCRQNGIDKENPLKNLF